MRDSRNDLFCSYLYPKMLQNLMDRKSMNTYTHLGLEDAADELMRMEELSDAGKELDKVKGENPVSQKMFRVIQWMKGEATPSPLRFGRRRVNVYWTFTLR